MLRTFRAVLAASTVMLLCSGPLVAQSNTGNVYGNVIDELGSPIPGGTATLTGTAAPRTASVDAGGFFRFLRVAPGKYTLTVTTPGFATVARENVLVSVGQNIQVDVPIEARDRAGERHGHERDAAHRHAQGRDGPDLHAATS